MGMAYPHQLGGVLWASHSLGQSLHLVAKREELERPPVRISDAAFDHVHSYSMYPIGP